MSSWPLLPFINNNSYFIWVLLPMIFLTLLMGLFISALDYSNLAATAQ